MPPQPVPRFTKQFRRLCQVAAVAGTGRTDEVVDGLLPVAMVYGDGPWREPVDWIDAIAGLFDLMLPEADVVAGLQRAVTAKRFTYNSYRREYELHRDVRNDTNKRIEDGERLERAAQTSWFEQIEPLVPQVSSDKLWTCLLNYAGKAFLAHGADAVELLGGRASIVSTTTLDDTPEALIRHAISLTGIASELLPEVAAAISVFFDGRDDVRVRYINELSNSTFNFLALGLDGEVRQALLEHLPPLTIFVDTNVIYGMIGAHRNPLAAASAEVFKVLRENNFPFKIYYHEKTFRELESTMAAVGYRLRRYQWTSSVSRSILKIGQGFTSIEMRYHELNADIPTSVDIFLSRYSSLPTLLAEYGLNIFRQSTSNNDDLRVRAELIAEYEEFARTRRHGNRTRSYSALDHDITIWLAAAARRTPRRNGPLFSGALVVTADHLFRQFDREILSPRSSSETRLATTPDTLLHALRPFMTSTKTFDAGAFTRVFAAPELRSIGRDHAETLNRVAAYLATYADLPEETATNLLANSMLMSRLKDIGERSTEFGRVIEEALVQENETLQQERDALRASAENTRSEAMLQENFILKELASLANRVDALADPDMAAHIDRIAAQFAGVRLTVNVEGSRVSVNGESKEYSGGYYENNQSLIAAQGPGAQAHSVTQQADQRRLQVDLNALSEQLDTLKERLVQEASSASDYQVVAEIQAAKEAVDKCDESSAAGHLARCPFTGEL